MPKRLSLTNLYAELNTAIAARGHVWTDNVEAHARLQRAFEIARYHMREAYRPSQLHPERPRTSKSIASTMTIEGIRSAR